MKTNATPPASPLERRCGHDRRQREAEPPRGWERRRGVEPRRPEVVELDLTPSQWDALRGDDSPAPSPAPPATRPQPKP